MTDFGSNSRAALRPLLCGSSLIKALLLYLPISFLTALILFRAPHAGEEWVIRFPPLLILLCSQGKAIVWYFKAVSCSNDKIKGGESVPRCLTYLLCSTFWIDHIWVCLWQFSMLPNRKRELTQHRSQGSVFVVKSALHLFSCASFRSSFCRLWTGDAWRGLVTAVATKILAPLDISIISSCLRANHPSGFVR